MHAASVPSTLPTTDHDQIFADEIMPILERVARACARKFSPRDPSGAEDIAAETMMRAWRSRATFRSGLSASAWVSAIARNTAFSLRGKASRDRRNEVAGADDWALKEIFAPAHAGTVEDRAIARLDAVTELARVLGELNPDRLAAIELAERGYSEIEIAKIQDCAVGTVGQRVFRGHEQAREARDNMARGRARAQLIEACSRVDISACG